MSSKPASVTDASSRVGLDGPFRAFTRYGSLTLEMSKREVLGRYRGASFGLLWSLISPFLMMLIYTIAFGYLMKARWPHAGGGTAGFALILFMGLIVHGFLADCIGRAPALVVGQTNLVKRIVFPLDILPWPVILGSLFHVLANMVVFIALLLVLHHRVPWTIVFFPVVFAPLVLVGAGVIWFLAALAVYMRDIGQITGVLVTALLFLSSAIIPPSTLPMPFRRLIILNPLTFIIDQARAVSLWGQLPDVGGLVLYLALALVFAYLGYFWFCRMRRGFADVL